MMILRVSNRVLLVLHILLVIQDLIMCQNRFDIDDTEDLDIPLLSKLDAPLKATLDISELNKQLTALIDKKVNAGVKKALENLVHKTIEKRIQVSQGEIVAWNNNTLGTLQNKLEGIVIFFISFVMYQFNTYYSVTVCGGISGITPSGSMDMIGNEMRTSV